MNKFFLALCSTALTTGVWAQTPADKTEKKYITNSQQTAAQQMIAATGEDSLNSYGAGNARTVLSGYGEFNYQYNSNLKTGNASLRRAVLFVGHQFTGRIAFFSELEVEDAKVEGGSAAGEVSMEQAYLKFSLNPRQYILAGLILPRLGIVNENHLPTNYNGVLRPQVEQLIIPSTWRELGVGFYGQSSALPFTYCVAVMNGLNSSGFTHGTGIEGGKADGQRAGANSLAINAAVQYFAGNWKFQLSGYIGGTTPLSKRAADSLQLESGPLGAPIYVGEGDVQYSNNGISFKALGCNISIPEAESINRAYDCNIASSMFGAYAELGYNLFEKAKKEKLKHKQLIAFARYESLDMNSKLPKNGVTDGTIQQQHLFAGFSYFPIPHVVVKADIDFMNTGKENAALILNPNPNRIPYQTSNTLFNLGIGYSF